MILLGYRSDVRIITSKKGYDELKKYVDTYLKKRDISYNLLDDCDVFKYNDKECYFGWNSVKWYDHSEGYEDVTAIEEGIEHLEEKDFSYRMSILGEDYDDYEERYHNGKEKNYLSDVPFCRYFDDEEINYCSEKEPVNSSPELEVAA